MNFVQHIIINIIIMLFPLMTYLFYNMFSQNVLKKSKDIMFDFAIITAVYLLIMYNQYLHKDYLILLNIPLLLAFLKRHSLTSIIISLMIIVCYININFNYILLVVLNFIIVYIIYLILKKHKKFENLFINTFMIAKALFLYLYLIISNNTNTEMFFKTTLLLIGLGSLCYFIKYVFNLGEDIINLFTNVKELEKDKQFRSSLFKITHEIKNPIAVCKSYLDMFDMNNKDHERYIPILKEEIKKILLLLQDFLSMSKIKIDSEVLDVVLLLEETKSQFELVMSENNINMNYQLLDDEVFISGDYNRLSQVLINMISNSVEADATEISIKTELLHKKIKLIIQDNGTGIDAEVMKKIKEPFYTTKKNGTGLGVSLSAEIINAHKGSINYISKDGKGTTVIIVLPLYEFN